MDIQTGRREFRRDGSIVGMGPGGDEEDHVPKQTVMSKVRRVVVG